MDGVATHKSTISINFDMENHYALKCYACTEVERRTWLHVPSGTHCPDSKWKLDQRWALSFNFRWANVGWRCKTISTLLIQKTLAQHVVQTLAKHVV